MTSILLTPGYFIMRTNRGNSVSNSITLSIKGELDLPLSLGKKANSQDIEFQTYTNARWTDSFGKKKKKKSYLAS